MADEARIEQLRQAVEQDPNDELANFSLGSALLEAGRTGDAGPHLQKVIAVNSQNSKAYELLGRVQQAEGLRDLAVETFTNGYRVAHRRGDMKVLEAIAAQLKELDAPIPQVAQKQAAAAATGKAGGFVCRRCGGSGPKLPARPFKGELGDTIAATVCQSCWTEWVGMGTKVINELRLPMYDPKAQEVYDQHMKEFLMID